MDTESRAKRSAIMAMVRGGGNLSTELQMIVLMRAAGITGWRRGAPLPGKPDFIFRAAKLAVFVDGCFSHSCPQHKRVPKSRLAFWRRKLARNAQRDRKVKRMLMQRGWRVLRIWEHELATKNSTRLLRRIQTAFAGKQRS